jgi:hypothetical protein
MISSNAKQSDAMIENQWRGMFIFGGITAILTLIGITLDIVFGSITGGNIAALPQTAIDRFLQFQQNPLLGLYNLDLLNVINQIILIPAYFAIFAALRKTNYPMALFALIICLIGSTVFITTNTALPMMELSKKYAIESSDAQKMLLAAAGEAMLARGMHGSLGVFLGFLLPDIGGLLLAAAMLHGNVFSRATALTGISGSVLMSVYFVLVTFVPAVKEMATAVAMPGGLLLMAWMVLFTIRLFQLGKQ